MVILGIYLKEGKKVTRNLKNDEWFPFGNIQDIHYLILNKKKKEIEVLKKKLSENHEFINKIYSAKSNRKKQTLSLNINCIVGKNGSGKSTLLNLYYRIINNFNCRINQLFPKLNEHKTVWSNGFDATLYYELNGKIYAIEIYDNISGKNNNLEEYHVKFYDENEVNLFDDFLHDKDYTFFENLKTNFFYTIAENYSIYPTTFTTMTNDSNIYNEEWEYKLYHKNDGYLTPIVLVPFKDDNIIDIGKESKLAAERVSTLSLLLQLNKSTLIENYEPEGIHYFLPLNKNYAVKLKMKLYDSYNYYYRNKLNDDELSEANTKKIHTHLNKINDLINSLFIISRNLWKSLLDLTSLRDDVSEYLLDYLSYKSIKITFNYQYFWKKYFDNSCIYEYFLINKSDENKIKQKIEDIIINEFNTTININHMNLKIVQCLIFIRNKKFAKNNQKDGYITIKQFKSFLDPNKKIFTYDDVFSNFLPSIYSTDISYKKIIGEGKNKKEINNIRLSEMSSGEQQKLFTLSYLIYHIKNIESITGKDRTTYENISIIIDEAELYYHPDLQREYLSELIKILQRSQINKIKNINILIATHSPFILSDIPCFNISGLEEGENRKFEEPTLGANIYDLFKNQFFMKSSIGKNSSLIFSEIIKDYHQFRKNKNEFEHNKLTKKYKSNLKTYRTLIMNIGDDYYQRTFGKMILRMSGKQEKEIFEELNQICAK